ncbi:MAG: C10 family peptidase [Candidatus Krumholzibacteriota bacterium]|nr:C10 family peptidase [Candidatus Krumholzibacteriota bacterium]
MKILRLLPLLLLAGLMLVPTAVQGRTMTETQVRAAVETWLRQVITDARPGAEVAAMVPHRVDGEVVGYIAELAGGGFCLCGADELILPVYLYSPRGTYDPGNPNHRLILSEIATRCGNLRQGVERQDPALAPYAEALARRARDWEMLAARQAPPPGPPRATPVSMTLDQTATWSQGDPYNRFCPTGDTGCTSCGGSPPTFPTLVGCVAVAGAQIMHYWGWPLAGTGDHDYGWDGDDSCGGGTSGGTLSATFSDAYDWANMPDNCDSGCSQAQQDALAELCYEVAVSVEMGFGVCRSGAQTDDLDHAMETWFKYDSDIRYTGLDTNTMIDQIQWLRPLVMDGCNGGCHAWIVTGYDTAPDPDMFLMNMGWGGYGNDWYVCDDIDYDGDGVTDFWDDQHHVIDIAPANVVRFVEPTGFGDGSPSAPYGGIDQALALAQDGTILIFKASESYTFSASTLVIDRPMVLRGYQSMIY